MEVACLCVAAILVLWLVFRKDAKAQGSSMMTTESRPLLSTGQDVALHESLEHLQKRVNLSSPDCPKRHEVRGTYVGKFLSCYDGDTCDVAILLPKTDGENGYYVQRHRVRTMGFNAPEIKQPKDEPNRDSLKELATKSRDLLWKFVSGNDKNGSDHETLVALDCHGFDKYGRLLVEVFPYTLDASNNILVNRHYTINQRMLQWLGPEYKMDNKGRMVM